MSRSDTDQTNIERRKLAIMRSSDTNIGNRCNIGGRQKARGWRRKPITLPSTETAKKLDRDDPC